MVLNCQRVLILSCGILITAFTLINRRWPLLNGIEDIGRKSFGTTAYGLSITLLVAFLWPERADAVTAGILVMGVGDGCAGLIGRHMNSLRWMLFDQTKSLAGTFTMAMPILCLIGLCLNANGISIPSVLIISVPPLFWNSSALLESTTSRCRSASHCSGNY